MNMKTLLATGLVASVAVTAAQAETCRDGGFYVGVNFGANFGKCNYKNDIEDQEGVLDITNISLLKYYENTAGSNAAKGKYYKRSDVKDNLKRNVSPFSASKSKTRFLGEIVVGYDFRIGDVMIGCDVAFGSTFGKVKKESAKGVALINGYQKVSDIPATAATVEAVTGQAYDRGHWGDAAGNRIALTPAPEEGDDITGPADIKGSIKETALTAMKYADPTSSMTVRFKNKFGFSIMPRVGYLITPDFEIFATAGVKIKSDKVTLTVKESENAEEKSYTKSKTKCAPAFGLGVNYAITPEIITRLEYNYICKSKISKKDDFGATHKAEVKGQEIKLGIGYRF
ncbi:MAG: porin family protein [Alphaproteobacteria bacterium]|nr:porin family protein [Alphaproteobacteria bacterium]